jgi:predicted DNA-binding transcriptional regulator AlpA
MSYVYLTRQLWPGQVVDKIVGGGKTRRYAGQRNGTFPPSIHLGRSARWLSDEVEAYRDFIIAKPRATDEELRKFVSELVAKRPTLAQVAA